MRLLEFSANIHSQTGEDGILSKVLDTLPTKDKWCVEFGAWDGEHLSNTCHLIEKQAYSAVLIEADKKRFMDLKKRHSANSRVTPLNRFVGFQGSDNLDAILGGTVIPRNFDLLSIDIDGNDYHVWKATVSYMPKIVCVEFNPTIHTELEFVQPAQATVSQGSSLLSIVRLGKSKGYELVAVTRFNAIFVLAEYFPLFEIPNNAPTFLREDVSDVAHIFCGYDGTIFHTGKKHLLWHGIRYHTRLRQLPKYFRGYPDNFGRNKSKLFRLYKKIIGY